MTDKKHHILLTSFKKDKANDYALAYIAEPKNLIPFFEIFYDGEVYPNQRASWIMERIAKKSPEILHPHIPKMLDYLDQGESNTIKRNITRTLSFLQVTDDQAGLLFERSMQFIADPKTPTAIRGFSLTNALNVVRKFDILKVELYELLERVQFTGTIGFKSGVKRTLALLKLEIDPN